MQRLISLLTALTILCSAVMAPAVYAQEESQSQPSADTGISGSSTGPRPYLHETQFSSEHDLVSLFSQCTEFFQTGDWEMTGGTLSLLYSASQVIDPELSTITVSLNGQSIYSQRVEPGTINPDGDIRRITLPLPPDLIVNGTNTLTIDTYVRVADSLPCVDDVNSSNWIHIYQDSAVALSYYPKAKINTISDCFQQFTSIDALENKQSALLIPLEATDAELTAASWVLSGISKNAALFYDNIGLKQCSGDENMFQDKYQIYLCEYSRLPASLSKRLAENPAAEQAAQESAVIALLKGENGNSLLLVTGNDPAAFANAGLMLANTDLVQQVQVDWRRVTADEKVRMEPAGFQEYQSLTQSGTYLKGPFHQSAVYYINFPANRSLAYSSQISIGFRYSENLDFDRSLITVSVNDTPIGSKKLEKANAQKDSAVFDIPTDISINGNFTVTVSFDLEIKDMWCTLNQGETPWAWISPDSMLKLSTASKDELIFENYPSPFIRDGSMNQVAVVLPDAYGTADLEVFRTVMLTLGRSMKDNAGSLRAARCSTMGDISESNIISIGTLGASSLVQQIKDSLFFQFSPDGNTLLSNEKMLIDSNYGAILGTAQLLDSPFHEKKRALMVITGVQEKGMINAAAYIGSESGLWKIYGDGYVADNTDVFPYRFKKDNEKKSPLLPQIAERADMMGLVVIAVLILGLMILSLVLLLIKYKRREAHEKQ